MTIELASIRRVFPEPGSALPVKTFVTLRSTVEGPFGEMITKTRDFTIAEAVALGVTLPKAEAMLHKQTEADLVRLAKAEVDLTEQLNKSAADCAERDHIIASLEGRAAKLAAKYEARVAELEAQIAKLVEEKRTSDDGAGPTQ